MAWLRVKPATHQVMELRSVKLSSLTRSLGLGSGELGPDGLRDVLGHQGVLGLDLGEGVGHGGGCRRLLRVAAGLNQERDVRVRLWSAELSCPVWSDWSNVRQLSLNCPGCIYPPTTPAQRDNIKLVLHLTCKVWPSCHDWTFLFYISTFLYFNRRYELKLLFSIFSRQIQWQLYHLKWRACNSNLPRKSSENLNQIIIRKPDCSSVSNNCYQVTGKIIKKSFQVSKIFICRTHWHPACKL